MDASAKCCQNDMYNIKEAIPRHMLIKSNDKLTSPLSDMMNKALCGFNHPQFACMLCPLSMLEAFDADPK